MLDVTSSVLKFWSLTQHLPSRKHNAFHITSEIWMSEDLEKSSDKEQGILNLTTEYQSSYSFFIFLCSFFLCLFFLCLCNDFYTYRNIHWNLYKTSTRFLEFFVFILQFWQFSLHNINMSKAITIHIWKYL